VPLECRRWLFLVRVGDGLDSSWFIEYRIQYRIIPHCACTQGQRPLLRRRLSGVVRIGDKIFRLSGAAGCSVSFVCLPSGSTVPFFCLPSGSTVSFVCLAQRLADCRRRLSWIFSTIVLSVRHPSNCWRHEEQPTPHRHIHERRRCGAKRKRMEPNPNPNHFIASPTVNQQLNPSPSSIPHLQ